MDSFKTLQDDISRALVSTTRSASHIGAADIAFQRSLNPEVGTQLDAQNARLLHLAQRLLANAAASSDAVGPKLSDVEAIDANWRGVVDVVDSLLEKADTSLDEYTGVVKRLSPGAEQVRPVAACDAVPAANRNTDACKAAPKHRREEAHSKAAASV
jgi:exosome complex exonuclease RRP6